MQNEKHLLDLLQFAVDNPAQLASCKAAYYLAQKWPVKPSLKEKAAFYEKFAVALAAAEKATADTVVLQKGETLRYLDYDIKNSTNNDGLVLRKEGELYLGNFGPGTAANLETAKRYAVIYFMLARPSIFAGTLANKIATAHSGTASEYGLFFHALKAEGLGMPSEVTPGDGSNRMIYFNGEPLTRSRTT